MEPLALFGRPDPRNSNIATQKAYYAIYHKGEYRTGELSFVEENRMQNKQAILAKIKEDLLTKLREEK